MENKIKNCNLLNEENTPYSNNEGNTNSSLSMDKLINEEEEISTSTGNKDLRKLLRPTLKKMNDLFRETQDLNPMINLFNEDAKLLNIPIFDIKNQKLKLMKKQLDKFSDTLGKVDKKEFQVEFIYEMEDQNKEIIFGKIL